ncbi:fibulin-1-like [Hydra vulgaris]|uniref:fibulin-1-like n=1 Tax=Hydra vulgaris TaxID=6087 RepID=UPI0032EA6A62
MSKRISLLAGNICFYGYSFDISCSSLEVNSSLITTEQILKFNIYKNSLLIKVSFENGLYDDSKLYLFSVTASLEDIDECNDNSRCPWNNSLCENTYGSYWCKCKNGWILGNDNFSCVDYNECRNVTHPCSWSNGICQNTNGSYLCVCNDGWRLSLDNASCIDIDECNETSPCHGTNVVCENRIGSYLCKCDQGWKLDVYNVSCFGNVGCVQLCYYSHLWR